ncbi:MAG TPA: hypothetical protein VHD87_02530 [Acidimicrobiales bacterium]|nr:hypothetical protein [Acidimicrobiales bacterium]
MDTDTCPVCATCPCVLIAVVHPVMRRLILDLLDREHGCWRASLLEGDLSAVLRETKPDLVVVDGADFPRCCRDQLADYPCNRVVVIGPEPDRAYKAAALRHGAGAWVARDDVGERLSAEMRHALGCHHGPCPTPTRPFPPTGP